MGARCTRAQGEGLWWLPSCQQISCQLGVSRIRLVYALQRLIGDQLIERRRRPGAFFRGNLSAKRLLLETLPLSICHTFFYPAPVAGRSPRRVLHKR